MKAHINFGVMVNSILCVLYTVSGMACLCLRAGVVSVIMNGMFVYVVCAVDVAMNGVFV